MENVYYDRKAGRVVIRGGGGQLLEAFDDSQSKIVAKFRKVGTTPQVTVGTLTSAIATISNMVGVKVGDHIVANPKAALLTGIIAGACRVPAADTVVVTLLNPLSTSVATQAAVGWDVLAIRSEA